MIRRYRTNSGLGHPYIAPQLARERRNLSISSLSSQTSSQGGPSTPSSLSSFGSPGRAHQFPLFGMFEQLIPAQVLVDTLTGDFVSSSSVLKSDGSGRYQTFLAISDAGGYSPQTPTEMAALPVYTHHTERRAIIIRGLSHDVTERGLHDLLETRDLANHCSPRINRSEHDRRCHALVTFATAREAREAVHKLHDYRFMDRKLEVEIARESTTVTHQRVPSLGSPNRPIIADGSI